MTQLTTLIAEMLKKANRQQLLTIYAFVRALIKPKDGSD